MHLSSTLGSFLNSVASQRYSMEKKKKGKLRNLLSIKKKKKNRECGQNNEALQNQLVIEVSDVLLNFCTRAHAQKKVAPQSFKSSTPGEVFF